MTEREFAIDVVRRLQEAGHEALWAGGCVRDELLGLVPKDYDVATNARPEQVQQLFRRALAVGASFGVIEVLGPRQDGRQLSVEVATFRTDGVYSDGRRPDEVVFSTAKEDAQRRDFTINGMFFDPLEGRLIDHVGGQSDLHARILRAIGDPAKRFEEDKLRLLRAVRLATRFELTIEPATDAAIRAHAATINVVSAERIAEELRQLLVHPRRSSGTRLLARLHLFEAILPELTGQCHSGPLSRRPDVTGAPTEHTLTVLEYLGPEPSFPLALASLLHELDKSHIVDDICLRLRLSNQVRERVVWLVLQRPVLDGVADMRTCRVKQLLTLPGIHELLALYRACALADGRSTAPVEHCEALLRQWSKDDLDPLPLVDGQDLIELGLKPGPQFKQILDAVRDAQLDGTIRTREEALQFVQQ